ncbi:hypothetical protein [Pandoraea anapnoica]|uniref:hypothetical protein n=1 Tax=Pandoraea anapnoica TaxID=2508301 RepID=UPI001241D856|nr:hypothetical protein [Pandoraea anapnoica]
MISPVIPVGIPMPPPRFFFERTAPLALFLTGQKPKKSSSACHGLRIRRHLAFKAVYALSPRGGESVSRGALSLLPQRDNPQFA